LMVMISDDSNPSLSFFSQKGLRSLVITSFFKAFNMPIRKRSQAKFREPGKAL